MTQQASTVWETGEACARQCQPLQFLVAAAVDLQPAARYKPPVRPSLSDRIRGGWILAVETGPPKA